MGGGLRLGQAANLVGEDAGGVDDDARAGLELLAGFAIDRVNAVDESVGVARERDRGSVVQDGGSVFGRGGEERNEQARIVELAIVVDDSPAQAVVADVGQEFESFIERKDARAPEAVLAREEVVDFEADAVEGSLPPGVIGDDEGEIANQMGRVLKQDAALLERFHHQRDVALLEIAHSAMNQLGAAAGGAFAEVFALQQEDGKAAAGRIESHACAGGAAADDDHVPRFGAAAAVAPALRCVASGLPPEIRLTPSAWFARDGGV